MHFPPAFWSNYPESCTVLLTWALGFETKRCFRHHRPIKIRHVIILKRGSFTFYKTTLNIDSWPVDVNTHYKYLSAQILKTETKSITKKIERNDLQQRAHHRLIRRLHHQNSDRVYLNVVDDQKMKVTADWGFRISSTSKFDAVEDLKIIIDVVSPPIEKWRTSWSRFWRGRYNWRIR